MNLLLFWKLKPRNSKVVNMDWIKTNKTTSPSNWIDYERRTLTLNLSSYCIYGENEFFYVTSKFFINYKCILTWNTPLPLNKNGGNSFQAITKYSLGTSIAGFSEPRKLRYVLYNLEKNRLLQIFISYFVRLHYSGTKYLWLLRCDIFLFLVRSKPAILKVVLLRFRIS